MNHIQTLELETEKKNKTISGLSTTALFILLALLLWLVQFEKPTKEELPEEYEIPVTLGDEPSGGGEGAPADEVPVEASTQVPKMSLPAATEQTTDENAVEQKRTSTTPQKNADPDASEEAEINKMLNSGKKGTVTGKGGTGKDPFGKGNGTGDGDGNGPGSGPGPGGNGFSVTGLGSRKLIGYVKAPDKCNVSGTVKLDIIVNPEGKIISAEGATGYDDNLCLVNRAKECIRNARFEQTSSSKLATGQITIVFSYK